MCSVGDNLWEFFADGTRKARKAHRCEECGRDIVPGETYYYYAGRWDGDFCDGKRCQHCEAVTHWLNAVCGGYVMGELQSELTEHYREGYGIWLARAAIGVRRKWRGRRGDLMTVMSLPDPMPEYAGY